MTMVAGTPAFVHYPSGPTLGSLVLWPVCRQLGMLPTAPVFLAYIIGAVLLTRAVLRHVRPMAFDLDHPALNPRAWAGVHPHTGFGLLQLMALLFCCGTGFLLPRVINDAMIACQPHVWGFGTPMPIGFLGRLAELVGGVCGLVIGVYAFGHILRWTVIGCCGFLALRVLQWVAG